MVVSGRTLTLIYDEALDQNSQPPTTAFTVAVNHDLRNVTALSVTSDRVVLTLPPRSARMT